MDDVVTLISTSYTIDEYGNQIATDTPRTVFCKIRSVGRTEFYQASQDNMYPTIVVNISHYIDYQGEKALLHTDWTGVERRYEIIRTYRTGDSIELTCEEKVSDYG